MSGGGGVPRCCRLHTCVPAGSVRCGQQSFSSSLCTPNKQAHHTQHASHQHAAACAPQQPRAWLLGACHGAAAPGKTILPKRFGLMHGAHKAQPCRSRTAAALQRSSQANSLIHTHTHICTARGIADEQNSNTNLHTHPSRPSAPLSSQKTAHHPHMLPHVDGVAPHAAQP